MKKVIINIAMILCFPFFLIAQTGSIQGKITHEESGETIIGAHVFIRHNQAKTGSATDLKGKYKIKPLSPGTYNVHISYMGKIKIVKGVNVIANNVTFLDETINPAVDLAPVVIVEHDDPLLKPDNPHLQRITPKQIENDPNKRDLKTLITSVTPGIVQSADGQQLYVRGTRPKSTQYFVDGVKARSGNINIPGMAIGNISVYTGGIPAKYGDVTGGVIVVETKSYYDLLRENRMKNSK